MTLASGFAVVLLSLNKEGQGAEFFPVYDGQSGNFRTARRSHLRELHYCVPAASFCDFLMHPYGQQHEKGRCPDGPSGHCVCTVQPGRNAAGPERFCGRNCLRSRGHARGPSGIFGRSGFIQRIVR